MLQMLCTCRGAHRSVRWDADVLFPWHVHPGKQQGHRQPSQIAQLAGADVSHMSAEGRIEPSDGTLMCSYHGWRFQGDGKCTTVPQALDSKANTAACSSARSCASTRPTQVSSPHALISSGCAIPSCTSHFSMHYCASDDRDTEVPDGRNESCHFWCPAMLVPEYGLIKT